MKRLQAYFILQPTLIVSSDFDIELNRKGALPNNIIYRFAPHSILVCLQLPKVDNLK